MKGNSYISCLKGSSSINMMQKADELKEQGIPIWNLSGGEPDFDTPDKIRAEGIKAIQEGDTHYAVGKGLFPLRKCIADKMQAENHIACTPEQVILTPGAKFGIYLTIASLINIGDEVLVFSPYWVSYGSIVEACGGKVIYSDLDSEDDYQIKEENILPYLTSRTKMIIINYPNNPTGRILHEKEALLLKDIVKKYHLYLLSDEVYEKIVYDGKKNISMGSYDEIAEQVITVNGFSKCVAMTGWRLGYVVADPELINIMYKLYTHTITGTSPFIQRAAIKAFECDLEIEAMRHQYEKRRDFFVSELNKINGIHCGMPEGAFYAWVRFETKRSASEIVQLLLDQAQILGVPGDAYGVDKDTFVRFSFATDMDVLKKAIDSLRMFKVR